MAFTDAELEAMYNQQSPAPQAPQQAGRLSDSELEAMFNAQGSDQPAVGYDTGNAVAGQLAQGASFGFGDEMEAGLRALEGKFGSYLTGNEVPSMGEMYDQSLGAIRGQNAGFEKDHPYASMALQVAGGIPTGLGISKAAATEAAAKLTPAILSRIASTPAGAGAIGGAVYGFGSGEDGLTNRLGSGVVGAGVGAVAGKAIDEGIKLGGKALQSEPAQRLAQLLGSTAETTNKASAMRGMAGEHRVPSRSKIPQLTPQEAAAVEMSRDIPLDRLASGIDELTNAGQMGQPMLPHEAFQSPRLAGEADALVQNPATMEIAKTLLDKRQIGARDRATNILDVISPRRTVQEGGREFQQGLESFVDDIKAVQARESAPYYRAAVEDNPIVQSDRLRELMHESPDIQAAIKDAKRFPEIDAFGKTYKTADLPDNHFLILDKAKKLLDDSASHAKGENRGRLAEEFQDLVAKFRGAIDEGSPTYGPGRAVSKRYFDTLEKVVGTKEQPGLLFDLLKVKPDDLQKMGTELLKKSPDDIEAIGWMLGDKYRGNLAAGIRSGLENKLNEAVTSGGVESFRKLANSESMKRKLAMAFPDSPEAISNFLTQVNREAVMDATAKRAVGSATNMRGQFQEKQSGMFSRVLKLIKGLGKGNGEDVVNAFVEGIPNGNDEVAKKIAPLLYGAPSETAPQWQKILQYRQARDPYIQAIAEKLIKPGQKVGSITANKFYSGKRER